MPLRWWKKHKRNNSNITNKELLFEELEPRILLNAGSEFSAVDESALAPAIDILLDAEPAPDISNSEDLAALALHEKLKQKRSAAIDAGAGQVDASAGQATINIAHANTASETIVETEAEHYHPRVLTNTLYDNSDPVEQPAKQRLANFDVTNINDSGAGSLRAAILNANTTPGADTITFSIAGSGPHTIQLASALPTITDALTIDGWSQTGFTSSPVIEIRGTGNDSSGMDGIHITSADVTVRGLSITNFDDAGIQIDSGGTNAGIYGNNIGIAPDGNTAARNFGAGIVSTADGVTIGTSTPQNRNVISANTVGIQIEGSDLNISGNIVGLNASGQYDRGNVGSGIEAGMGSFLENATISANTISGNGGDGISVDAPGGSDLYIGGNRIGTDFAVENDTGNDAAGIRISDTAFSDYLSIEQNTIAFNTQGILLDGTAENVRWEQNAIYGNDLISVDLGGDGPTANDAGDTDTGPNTLINFPTLTSASFDGTSTTIVGQYVGAPSTGLQLYFYASPTIDETGRGQSKIFLGGQQTSTNAAGNRSISYTTPVAVPDGWYVTATAEDYNDDLNSSEYSPAVAVTTPGITLSPLAGDAITPELAVNQTTVGDQTVWGQRTGATAINSSGVSVVTWTDTSGADGDSWGVYARMYSANGTPLSNEILVSSQVAGDQSDSVVGIDDAGNWVVAWLDAGDRDGDDLGVFAARFDINGSKIGNDFRVNAFTAGDQHSPLVAVNSQGEFAIAWTDDAGNDGDGSGVFLRVYDSAGVISGLGTVQVNGGDPGDQNGTGIDMNDDGDVVVVWTSDDFSGTGIFAAKITPTNFALVDLEVNTITSGSQLGATVGVDQDGNFAVAWQSVNADGSGTGVFTRAFDSNGTPYAPETLVNQSTDGDQGTPSLAMDNAGTYVVAFTDNESADGSGSGVFARRFGTDGTPISDQFRLSTSTQGSQFNPNIDMNPSGLMIGAWNDGSGSANREVVARLFQAGQATNEAGASASYTIQLNTQPTADVIITPTLVGDEGVSTVPATIVFNSGNWNTPADIIFFGVDDAILDGDQSYGMSFSVSSTDPNYDGMTLQDIVLVNLDDESPGQVIVVNTTLDITDGDTSSITNLSNDPGADGFISLREAILASNNTANGASPDEIHFNIPDNDPNHYYYAEDGVVDSFALPTLTTLDDAGISDFDSDYVNTPFSWFRLEPSSELPLITDTVIIDGYSQAGSVQNTADISSTINARLRIELSGAQLSSSEEVLEFGSAASGSSLLGLVVNRALGNGIYVHGSGQTIQGSFIGTDPTGQIDLGNGFHGISTAPSASGLQIGGTNPEDRNLVSGNYFHGINLTSGGNSVQGNFIGTDITGQKTPTQGDNFSNRTSGLNISGDNSVVGGTSAAERNVFSGNGIAGVRIQGGSNNVVTGNYFGTTPSGGTFLDSNNGHAFYIQDSASNGNRFGGLDINEWNLVDGVPKAFTTSTDAGSGNSYLGNRVTNLSAETIDLMGDGITPNDIGDTDTGPNDLLNAPVITLAQNDGGNLQVQVAVNAPLGHYRVEIFSNPSGGNGGEVLIGAMHIEVTNASSYVSYSTVLSSMGASENDRISATLTASDVSYTSFGSTSEFGPRYTAPNTLVVDTASDLVDGDTTSLVTLLGNKGADERISLREAILATNNQANVGGNDQILFDIPEGSNGTIDPDGISGNGDEYFRIVAVSALPTITEAVSIDARSQSGYAGTPKIAIDGTLLSNNSDGFYLESDGSAISGFSIVNFPDNGIELWNSSSNLLFANHIGAGALGTEIGGGNQSSGIYLGGSSNDNFIGGTNVADKNVISNNVYDGVHLSGTSSNNTLRVNYIGTDVTGTLDRGNGFAGVRIDGLASVNSIGTPLNGRNIISGNASGIEISGPGGNFVHSNLIGLDATATNAIANTTAGIIINNSDANTVGGTSMVFGNAIAGGAGSGIVVNGSGSTAIRTNIIGTNQAGNIDLGFAENGIEITDSPNTLIRNNLVSGSGQHGISISGNVSGSQLLSNRVGTNSLGTAPLPNLLDGIRVGTGASGVTIGNAPGELSRIAFNGGAGIGIDDNASEIRIDVNSIHSNGGLGIDLGNDGPTANDEGPPPDQDAGANTLINSPLLFGAEIQNGIARVSGIYHGMPSSSYELRYYAHAGLPAAGYDEGADSLSIHLFNTDASGVTEFEHIISSANKDDLITGFIVDSNGNSSEFSNVVEVKQNTLIVDTASDVLDGDTSSIENLTLDKGADGRVSLREAIIATNNSINDGEPDRILFDIHTSGAGYVNPDGIAGNGDEYWLIQPNSALPLLSDTVLIDGTSQPQYSNHPVIEINGVNIAGAASGLRFDSGSNGSQLTGLALTDWDIGLALTNSSNHQIRSNHIGADTTGLLSKGNNWGIYLQSASNITIGTDGVDASSNVISGNNVGILIDDSSTNNSTLGNLIGVAADGNTALGNTSFGIQIVGATSSGNIISGGNVISANLHGLSTSGASTIIQSNLFGTNATDTADIGNSVSAITINPAANASQIGGVAAGNIIRNTGGTAITLPDATGGASNVRISENVLTNNGFGIDLGGDGATPNDASDADLGANNLLNTPTIDSVIDDGSGSVTINGSLNTVADTLYRVEFFASSAAHASGFGEAEVFLGSSTVFTDASGFGAFVFNVPSPLAAGAYVSATSQDTATGDTSEFSLARIIEPLNSAPVLDASASPSFGTIAEDSLLTPTSGVPIENLVDFATPSGQNDNVTDADAGAVTGIAIHDINPDGGALYMSLDGGANWSQVVSASQTNALLLAADGATRLAYVPTPNYNGSIDNLISFRAWDQFAGSNGGRADVTTSGGTTAFSTSLDTANITVSPVNDVPVFSNLDLVHVFIEDSVAVVLDPNVSVFDQELSTADNFAGSFVSINRSPSSSINDEFFGSGNLGALIEDGDLVLNGVIVGTVGSNSGGILRLDFNSNATQARVDEVLQSIAYRISDDTPPANITLDWQFHDGTDNTIVATNHNINAVNDTPFISVAGDLNASEQTPLELSNTGYLFGDQDVGTSIMALVLTVDHGTLTINTGDSGVTIIAGNGSGGVSVNGQISELNALFGGSSSGTIQYLSTGDTPPATATLTATLNDNGGNGADPGTSGTAGSEEAIDNRTINISSVNDAPIAANADAAETYTEDQALNLIDIVVSDPDDSNVTVRLELSSGVIGSFSVETIGATTSTFDAGTGEWNASGPLGDVNTLLQNLVFTPGPDFNSDFTVEVSANDGKVENSTTKWFTGIPVNDAPVLGNHTLAENYTEDQPLSINPITVNDVDGDVVTVSLSLSDPAAGTLNTPSAGSASSTFDAATGEWQASGLTADLNAMLAGLIFTPSADYNSNFQMIVTAADGQASATAGIKAFNGSDTNDAPSASGLNAAESYIEDNTTNLTSIVVSDIDSANITVTLSLSDNTVGTIETTASNSISPSWTQGSGEWIATGSIADVNQLLEALRFVPNANVNTDFSIDVDISDGTTSISGTKLISGTPVNDAPTASNLFAAEQYVEDTSLNLLNLVIADIDSASLRVELSLSNPAAGALSTATRGTTSSSYDSSTGIWIATGPTAEVNSLLAGLAFAPALNYDQDLSISVTVSDATLAISGSRTLSAQAVDDPPTISNVNVTENTLEDTHLPLQPIVLQDVDSSDLTISLWLSDPAAGTIASAIPGNGSHSYNSLSGEWTASGSVDELNNLLSNLVFTPGANYDSNLTFSVTLADDTTILLAGTRAINIIPVNDLPQAANDAGALSEGGSTVINLASNDQDIEGLDLASLEVIEGPSNGALVINGNGTISYLHNDSETTSDGFRYLIRDIDGAASNIAQVDLNITAVNDNAPVAVGENYITSRDQLFESGTSLLDNDNDIDGDSLSVVLLEAPSHGALTINADGTVRYQPNEGYIGSDTFSYQVSDGDFLSSPVSAEITVRPPQIIPIGEEPEEIPTGEPPTPEDPEENPPSPVNTPPVIFERLADDRFLANDKKPRSVNETPSVKLSVIDVSLNDADVRLELSFEEVRSQSGDDDTVYLHNQEALEQSEFKLLFELDALVGELETLRRQSLELDQENSEAIALISSSGIAISAGVIAWTLRGGALLASLLSTLPTWRGFDPLPVIARRDSEDARRSDAAQTGGLFERDTES